MGPAVDRGILPKSEQLCPKSVWSVGPGAEGPFGAASAKKVWEDKLMMQRLEVPGRTDHMHTAARQGTVWKNQR